MGKRIDPFELPIVTDNLCPPPFDLLCRACDRNIDVCNFHDFVPYTCLTNILPASRCSGHEPCCSRYSWSRYSWKGADK